jgi:hypothetical protein
VIDDYRGPKFEAAEIAVRPAVCVTVPEAGVVVVSIVVRGDELSKMSHVVGSNLCYPGKWYCCSLSVNGSKMQFGRAMGEYSSIMEAEKAAQELADEFAKRVQEKTLAAQLRNLYQGGEKQ